MKKDDSRKTGLFPKQQTKVENEIHEERKNGDPVSTLWVRARMKFHCEKDQPPGYHADKNKFLKKWCYNVLGRKGLYIRRKANKKKQCIFEKLHNVKNYHHYTVFELADEDISSEESSSEESSSDEPEDEDDEIITSNQQNHLLTNQKMKIQANYFSIFNECHYFFLNHVSI